MTKNIFIGTLPPPLTGMTKVTEFIVREIKNKCRLKVINISGQKTKKSSNWKFYKAVVTFKAILKFICVPYAKNANIYLVANSNWGLIYNIIFAVLARIKNYRIYLHHHVFSYISAKDIRMKLIDIIMGRNSTHIVLCNEMAKKLKINYETKNRILILSNAFIYSNKWKQKTYSPQDHFLIGHISNLSVEKGLDLVVETFIELKNKDIPSKLILAGPIKSKKEKKIIDEAQLKFAQDIEYRGIVHKKEKEKFFNDIDLMLFPTKYDAQPLVVFEAILKGIPVIASDKGCIKSMIGKTGGAVIKSENNFSNIAASIIEDWIRNKVFINKVKFFNIKSGIIHRNISKTAFQLFINEFCNYSSSFH